MDGKLAIKDLPRVFYAEDVGFDTDSTLESVARLFDKGKVVDAGVMKPRNLTVGYNDYGFS